MLSRSGEKHVEQRRARGRDEAGRKSCCQRHTEPKRAREVSLREAAVSSPGQSALAEALTRPAQQRPRDKRSAHRDGGEFGMTQIPHGSTSRRQEKGAHRPSNCSVLGGVECVHGIPLARLGLDKPHPPGRRRSRIARRIPKQSSTLPVPDTSCLRIGADDSLTGSLLHVTVARPYPSRAERRPARRRRRPAVRHAPGIRVLA